MTLELDSIPEAGEAPPDAAPSTVLSELARPRHRRGFLRAIGYAGLTVGASALALPFLAGSARAESHGGLQGHDGNNCKPAYPSGYGEEKDTHGAYKSEPAACFGGARRGSSWCSGAGWHRSDVALDAANPLLYTWIMWPVSIYCGSPVKNAWRWTTTGTGTKVWRCSDGHSMIVFTFAPWWTYAIWLSICRARVFT